MDLTRLETEVIMKTVCLLCLAMVTMILIHTGRGFLLLSHIIFACTSVNYVWVTQKIVSGSAILEVEGGLSETYPPPTDNNIVKV